MCSDSAEPAGARANPPLRPRSLACADVDGLRRHRDQRLRLPDVTVWTSYAHDDRGQDLTQRDIDVEIAPAMKAVTHLQPVAEICPQVRMPLWRKLHDCPHLSPVSHSKASVAHSRALGEPPRVVHHTAPLRSTLNAPAQLTAPASAQHRGSAAKRDSMKTRPPWTPTYKISALRQLHPLVGPSRR